MSLAALAVIGLAAPGLVGAQSAPAWSLEEDLRFLAMDTAETAFPDVRHLVVDPDGRLYAGFHHLRTIRIFAPDGSLAATFGGPGADPGEMGGISHMSLRGDTLHVLDGTFRRIVHFGPDGAALGHTRLDDEERRPDTPRPPFPARLLPDGSALFVTTLPGATRQERPRARIFLHGAPGGPLPDTVLSIPFGAESERVTLAIGEREAHWDNPYIHTPLHALAPDGTAFVVLERPLPTGEADGAYVLTRIGARGDTLFSRAYSYTPEAVDRSVVHRALARAFLPLLGGAEDDVLDAVRRAVRLPDFVPPVLAVRIGADQSIWLRMWRVPGQPEAWLALDALGEPLGLAELPAGVTLTAMSADALYTTAVVGRGLHVVRFRLRRR